ncbi:MULTISPECIES: hypothetical protein [unclassified Streptomyces]|uniref:hypothetical protein n=1 Tax=unclassified Streptomyces TaxID=2593676 RepID=UPI001EF0E2C6|nr:MULTISPECIES: hypothetical protein [unclassified Streptomyces]
MGAQGVSSGPRFLASTEMNVSQDWKQRIVGADAVDAVKALNGDRVLPPYSRPGNLASRAPCVGSRPGSSTTSSPPVNFVRGILRLAQAVLAAPADGKPLPRRQALSSSCPDLPQDAWRRLDGDPAGRRRAGAGPAPPGRRRTACATPPGREPAP